MEGGVDSIVDELRALKELAINSANDTNADKDRVIIQKEFVQKTANINDIATMTTYNGKHLLDGTFSEYQITKTNTSTITSTVTLEEAAFTTDETTGDITITTDGEFNLDSSYNGKKIIVASGDVTIVGDSDTTFENINIVVSQSDAHLTVTDLNLNFPPLNAYAVETRDS